MRTIAIVIIGLILSGCVTVGAGERCVTYNSYTGNYGKVLGPGTHGLNFIAWDAYSFPVTQKSIEFEDVDCRSKDGLDLTADITIFYKASDDEADLQHIYDACRGDFVESLVVPKTRDVLRDVFGVYDSEIALSQQRTKVADQIVTELNADLNRDGVIILGVALRDIDPPATVQAAIDTKIAALEKRKTAEQDALAEEARRRGIGKAEYAEAQEKAKAIREIQEALSASPSYLQYLMIEKMAEDVKVIYTPDGAVPLLDMEAAK